VSTNKILDGQVIVVTGAGRGIGRAIAIKLAAVGAKVVVNDLGVSADGEGSDTGPAAEVVKEISDLGGVAIANFDSVAEWDSAHEIIQAAIDNFGRVDGLVNNAGIVRDNLLLRMKPEEWNDVLQTNLSGLFYTCKACLRGMMKRRSGRIINIASVIGVMGNAGQSNYAAAKAGVIGFSKSLAREVAPRGITVNVVAPGFIQTAMTNRLGEELRRSMVDQIPLGRIGQPDDVAAAVLFLASPAGAYITGETIHVNGGMSMV